MPRLTAVDFPQPDISPLTIGQMYMQSFQQATNDVRQREADDMRAQEFAMRQEQWHWERENIRPLEMEASKLRLLQGKMGVQQTGANLARANVQTANELLKHRAIEVTDNGLMGHMARLGTSIESYRASVGLPPLAGPSAPPNPNLPPSTPNPSLDMSAPADDDTSLPASSAPSPAPPTDMPLEEYPFDRVTGDMLSPEQIEARKNAPSPAPDGKPSLASAGLAVPKLSDQGQPSAQPAAPQTPDLSMLDRLEETRTYVMATTAPNSRERAENIKSVLDMERIVLAQPGILQAKAQWEASKVTQADQEQAAKLTSQMQRRSALIGQPLTLPPTVKIDNGKMVLAKTGEPLTAEEVGMVAETVFVGPAKPDPAAQKSLEKAQAAIIEIARADAILKSSADDGTLTKATADRAAAYKELNLITQGNPQLLRYAAQMLRQGNASSPASGGTGTDTSPSSGKTSSGNTFERLP